MSIPRVKNAITYRINGGESAEVKFKDGLVRKFVLAADRLKDGVNTVAFKAQLTGIMYRLVFKYWRTGKDVKPMDQGITVKRQFFLLDGKGGTQGDQVRRYGAAAHTSRAR